jgi:hypothetical protein
MATDEGVLGRSVNFNFTRDAGGRLNGGGADLLYTLHRYEKSDTRMNLLFRDHTMSDLIGFVYSGMGASEAAHHLINNIRHAAQPVLDQGRDAVVPIILDGENAWEYYPASGREFLRRFYDALQHSSDIEAVTVSEAIERHQNFRTLGGVTPGSWISANFNVWIGAPEDNKAWDYLYAAREFYEQNAPAATEEQRKLAYEEILIAEGSDWNWWYGPEHHSANDRDFDELYRKHLANVYHALGATPPDYLVQPITASAGRPAFVAQTSFVHPRIDGEITRYFEWMGAAMYTADLRAGAMHGKQYFLDSVYAGVDEQFLYGRVDFAGGVPGMSFDLVVNVESQIGNSSEAHRKLRLDASVESKTLQSWSVTNPQNGAQIVDAAHSEKSPVQMALKKVFEFRVPLEWLRAPMANQGPQADRLGLRVSLWHDRLPVDALPVEGAIELQLVTEAELMSGVMV